MSSSPVIYDDADERMSEAPQEVAERPVTFKDWMKLFPEAPLDDDDEDDGDDDDEGDAREIVRNVVENHGKKRLFVCCDGTWLNASGTVAPLSNVAKLARSVNRVGDDPISFETIGGVPQLVYYSSGIGTRSSLAMDSNVAAATGKGISHVIRDAYCFLSNNYNGVSNKDEIILVGFSRGAFTVRCLAQFISDVGLLRRYALPFLPVLYEDWVKNDENSLKERLNGTKGDPGQFYDDVKIKILAEWDPVDTLGVPYIYRSKLERRMKAKIVPKQVEHAFLALSLGERRKSYWPTVWKEMEDTKTSKVSQCAFSGDHGDVGGGHPDAGLSTISLLWMVSKIRIACGASFQMYALLQFNTPIPDTRRRLVPFGKRKFKVRNMANMKGAVHQPSFGWSLPYYLTFGMLFSGRRESIIHDLAAYYQNSGCNLEVHPTVRLLKEKRNFSPRPLHEAVEGSDGRYKWILKGNTHLPIYEQSLSDDEKKLLGRWKVQAQIWQRGSTFNLPKKHEEHGRHNWLYEWEGITQNKAWGYVEGGYFEDSLIKAVCDGLGIQSVSDSEQD